MPFKMPGRKRGNLQITISQYHPDNDEKDEKDEGMSENAARGFAKMGKYAMGKMKGKKKSGMRYGAQAMKEYKNMGKYGA